MRARFAANRPTAGGRWPGADRDRSEGEGADRERAESGAAQGRGDEHLRASQADAAGFGGVMPPPPIPCGRLRSASPAARRARSAAARSRSRPRQRPDGSAAHQRRGVVEQRDRRVRRAAIAGIADGDQHVADEAVAADALDRRAAKARPEAGVVERQRAPPAAAREIVAGGELRLRAALGELVPRADGEAVVAAIDAIADRGAELVRDRPLVLDGEIGDAAPRIEPVGRGKRVGRADVEAGAARAAMVLLGRVRRESAAR